MMNIILISLMIKHVESVPVKLEECIKMEEYLENSGECFKMEEYFEGMFEELNVLPNIDVDDVLADICAFLNEVRSTDLDENRSCEPFFESLVIPKKPRSELTSRKQTRQDQFLNNEPSDHQNTFRKSTTLLNLIRLRDLLPEYAKSFKRPSQTKDIVEKQTVQVQVEECLDQRLDKDRAIRQKSRLRDLFPEYFKSKLALRTNDILEEPAAAATEPAQLLDEACAQPQKSTTLLNLARLRDIFVEYSKQEIILSRSKRQRISSL